ncbi:hypothetical protein ACQ29_gp283 [Escherichia phage PBECO4]|uniref:Uncharacterized protein n=1 Tax=Escherichia phage PBECO4 TaxID=1273738 RepID=L7TLH2_9CAUD|nr:hypothetical protein ACQ29_gp283 [Escherichia phage PBECO4]AGC34963.1 hypothetical protein [Escherichia phage PBECO4]OTE92235.1 hypothetical protein B1K96_15340 [Escherichia coli]QDF14166.1 hypothetical protein vBEcoMphAPEC6_gp543c [Escherichia phage vB_EcoM_phAPEC6]WIL01102.1 hypothetical protein [Escherichia phage vB_EcoM_CRJP21]
MYKEFYIKELPKFLQGNLLEDEPRGIDCIYEADYFRTCTEQVLNEEANENNYQVQLYHTLYLAFQY